MKQLKNIFGHIWAVWGSCVFICTMLVALLFMSACFFLKDPKRAAWQQKVSRVWMTVFLALTGCRLKIHNKHFYLKKQNYIIVCNHNSFMDVIATNPFLPNASKTIAKKSLAKTPLFGLIYRWGSVLVDRNNEASRKQSYFDMKAVLAMGMDMVLFPEGTRNKGQDPLKRFQKGAFRLSVDTGVPILPVVLFGTRSIMPADKGFYLFPGTVEMHYLPPVFPEALTVDELNKKVFEIMWNYFEANY